MEEFETKRLVAIDTVTGRKRLGGTLCASQLNGLKEMKGLLRQSNV